MKKIFITFPTKLPKQKTGKIASPFSVWNKEENKKIIIQGTDDFRQLGTGFESVEEAIKEYDKAHEDVKLNDIFHAFKQ